MIAVDVSSPSVTSAVASLSSGAAGAALEVIAENYVDLVIPSPVDADGIQRSERVTSWSLDMFDIALVR